MAPPDISLSVEELELLNELLSERIGIHFSEPKRCILESRLQSRLRALQLPSFKDYYLYLQYGGGDEFDELIECVTNNESYFFRETIQFESLFDASLGGLAETRDPRLGLRVLCAGCSSGEEPYTMRIFAAESVASAASAAGTPPLDLKRLTIDAFDIDSERLRIAERAEYTANSLRALGRRQIARYFEARPRERFALASEWRQQVRFSRANLLDRASFAPTLPYDVITCRNVLIYFTEPARRRALENLAACLRPGGLLFLSVTESILNLTDELEMVRAGRATAYRRTAP